MMNHNKVKLIAAPLVLTTSVLLSGCSIFSGLRGNEEEPAIIYRTEYVPVQVPDRFFEDGCPPWVNPPIEAYDDNRTPEDQQLTGDWINLIQARYSSCRNTISAIGDEQDSIVERIEGLNQTLEENRTESKRDQ